MTLSQLREWNVMLSGSSIWLVDVNRQLPSVHLDGFDNSVDQFPSKEWLPDNISLHRLDVLKPIPEELKGKYDLVHVRLFLAVVQDYDPMPILRNLMDMLSQWTFHPLNTALHVCCEAEADIWNLSKS